MSQVKTASASTWGLYCIVNYDTTTYNDSVKIYVSSAYAEYDGSTKIYGNGTSASWSLDGSSKGSTGSPIYSGNTDLGGTGNYWFSRKTSDYSVQIYAYANGAGTVKTASAYVTIPALDKYTYAYKEYTGNGTSNLYNTSTQTHYYGNAVVAKSPTRDGFWFSGWTYNGTTYSPGSSINVNANITLEGHWIPYEQEVYVCNTDDEVFHSLGSSAMLKYGSVPSENFKSAFSSYKEYDDDDPYKNDGYDYYGWYQTDSKGNFINIYSQVFDINQEANVNNAIYWTSDGKFNYASADALYLRQRRVKKTYDVILNESDKKGTVIQVKFGSYKYKDTINLLPTALSLVPDGYTFVGYWDDTKDASNPPIYKKYTQTSVTEYVQSITIDRPNFVTNQYYLSAVYRDVSPTPMYYISSSFAWTSDSLAESNILPQYFNYALGRNTTFTNLNGGVSHTLCGCIKFYSPDSETKLDIATLDGSVLLSEDQTAIANLPISNIGMYYYSNICYLLFYLRDTSSVSQIDSDNRYTWSIKPSASSVDGLILDDKGKPLQSNNYIINVTKSSLIADVNKFGTSVAIGGYASDSDENLLRSNWELKVNNDYSDCSLYVLTPKTDEKTYYPYTLYHSGTELDSGIYKVPKNTVIEYNNSGESILFPTDGFIEVVDGIDDECYKFARAYYSEESISNIYRNKLFSKLDLYSSKNGGSGASTTINTMEDLNLEDDDLEASLVSVLGKQIIVGYNPSLCFTAVTPGSTVAMSVTGTPTLNQNFEYSTDGFNWITFIPGTTIITLNKGEEVYFRGDNPNGVNESSSSYIFVMTGSLEASGDIMSLIDNGACATTVIPNGNCYRNLFSGCSSLITAPELTATKLQYSCYDSMFADCTSLKTAPTLPATTMIEGCYYSMFDGCISLVEPPELPATTLDLYCYYNMFNGCTSLTTAPKLPATTLRGYCYYKMFNGCSSLITVPQLPAVELKERCYYRMFDSCTSLYVSDSSGEDYNKVWQIPTSDTFTSTYSQGDMFYGCKGTRSSDDMAGASGSSYTYYTQNTPI